MVEVFVVVMAVVVVVLVPVMGNFGTGMEISPGGLGGSGRLSVSKKQITPVSSSLYSVRYVAQLRYS